MQRSLAESAIHLRRREDATPLAQRTPVIIAAVVSGLMGILIGALFL
jgi:hypothetical protein